MSFFLCFIFLKSSYEVGNEGWIQISWHILLLLLNEGQGHRLRNLCPHACLSLILFFFAHISMSSLKLLLCN